MAFILEIGVIPEGINLGSLIYPRGHILETWHYPECINLESGIIQKCIYLYIVFF